MTLRNRPSVWLRIFVGLMALGMPGAAAAEAPEVLRFQGVISELQGGPVPDGNYVFRAEIFDAAVGGTPLFSSPPVTAPVVAGAYSLPIAPATPGGLKAALQGVGARFVEITVLEAGGNPINETLLPRQELASVPYAINAIDLDRSLVLVDQHVAADEPEVVLSLPAGFDRFEIDLVDVLPSSTGLVDLVVHVSTDGGSTFDQVSGDYAWNILLNSRTGVTPGQGVPIGSDSDSRCLLTYPDDAHRLTDDPTLSFSGGIEVQNAGGQGRFQYMGSRAYLASGYVHGARALCLRTSTARVDAVRFTMSSGNVKSGKFSVYGKR